MTRPKRLWYKRLMILKAGQGHVLGLTLGLMLCGCEVSSMPSHRDVPHPLDVQVDYTSGSTLSAPGPMDINSLRVEESFGLSIQLYALEKVPPQELEPIQKHIRLVMVSPRPNFLAPVMRLTAGARVAFSDVNDALVETMTSGDWGRVVPVGDVNGILPPNVAAAVDLTSTVTTSIRGHHLRLLLARRQQPDPNAPDTMIENLEIALLRTGRVPPAEDLTAGMVDASQLEAGVLETVTQRVAMMPVPLTSPYRCLLLIPFGWDSPWAGAIGLQITLERFPGPPVETGQLEAFAQCVDALMRQAERMNAIHSNEPSWAGCLLALEQLVWRSHWRRALVDLTHTGHAALARDIALGAPGPVAHGLARAIYTGYVETSAENVMELSWLMEKTAYEVLLKMAEDDTLTPALSTYLLRHAGQLARQVGTLREQLGESRSLSDLERRLIRENRISLEDMSPAARSRAHGWLLQRDKAPLGYDPLASIRDRRAALQAAQEEKGAPVD